MTLRPEFTKRNSKNAVIPGFMLRVSRGDSGIRTPWFSVRVSSKYLGIYWKPNVDRNEGDVLFLGSKFWAF